MNDKVSTAVQLLTRIGVSVMPSEKQAHAGLNASATKAGPGRYHEGGNAGNRLKKDRAVRAYKALMNATASKRVTKAILRDEHGAYTLTGGVYTLDGEFGEPNTREVVLSGSVGGGLPPEYTLRRKWLGGISEQRGY